MTENVDTIAAEKLRSFIERIEKMEEEKAEIAAGISDIYTQAKLDGFDAKIIRRIVQLRKMDKDERDHQDAIMRLYRSALGMDE